MTNNDLVWDINQFNKKNRASRFIMSFENKICVYSHSVEQLYSNYSIFMPQQAERKAVILPNPSAYHDTFQLISNDAIYPTGLYIVAANPKNMNSKLNLAIPKKSNNHKKRYKLFSLDEGLDLINNKRPDDKPFLPVLIKGDLRELNSDTPCLHLHAINIDKLVISHHQSEDIKRVVLNNLSQLSMRV